MDIQGSKWNLAEPRRRTRRRHLDTPVCEPINGCVLHLDFSTRQGP
jgi:hypothetical protein